MNEPLFSYFSSQEQENELFLAKLPSFQKESSFLFDQGENVFNTELDFIQHDLEYTPHLIEESPSKEVIQTPSNGYIPEDNLDDFILESPPILAKSASELIHGAYKDLIVQKVSQKKICKRKSIKRHSKSESMKNIHRYMIRQVIRALTSEDFRKKAEELCNRAEIEYESVRAYYLSQIESFTSIKLLREHWKVDPFDASMQNSQKMVFRDFTKWFLKEKAIRYILNGKMEENLKLKYIHYKNHVMLYYVDHPEAYNSNNRTNVK